MAAAWAGTAARTKEHEAREAPAHPGNPRQSSAKARFLCSPPCPQPPLCTRTQKVAERSAGRGAGRSAGHAGHGAGHGAGYGAGHGAGAVQDMVQDLVQHTVQDQCSTRCRTCGTWCRSRAGHAAHGTGHSALPARLCQPWRCRDTGQHLCPVPLLSVTSHEPRTSHEQEMQPWGCWGAQAVSLTRSSQASPPPRAQSHSLSL